MTWGTDPGSSEPDSTPSRPEFVALAEPAADPRELETMDLARVPGALGSPRSSIPLEPTPTSRTVSATAVLAERGITLPPTLDGRGVPAQVMQPPANAIPLGRFRYLEEIGRGGMGRIVEAWDPELRRTVALKVVIDPRSVRPEQLARFVAEAQITSQLGHPNIVPVHEIGATVDGRIYFAMKKVEGQTLRQVLNGLRTQDAAAVERWTLHRLLVAFSQICQAVAYAHDRGVLHRDIKPGNIMLGSFGEVYVMDFGVARVLADTRPELLEELPFDGDAAPRGAGPVAPLVVARTLDGAAIGTPGYMSPEQARGELSTLDGRADVWSLGAILFEILTLEPAFRGRDPRSVMFATAMDDPPDPRSKTPSRPIADEIAEICLRAMARSRDGRTPTAAALAGDIERFLEGARRREAAQAHLGRAMEAWRRWQVLAEERGHLDEAEADLRETIKPWDPLEAKAELLAVQRRLEAIGKEQIEAFEELVSGCESARSQDPDGPGPRRLLATAYLARFAEADARGDHEQADFFGRRAARFDDGTNAGWLMGTGALTLRTDPAGAEVTIERFAQEGLVWERVDRRVLGTTPLRMVPLEMGSYVLTVRAPGKRDTTIPVLIGRCEHVGKDAPPIPLYSDAEIGDGFVYVPGGPFIEGGDSLVMRNRPRAVRHLDGFFLSALPVTMGEYCEFLNAEHARDPDKAWLRSPRQASGLNEDGGQYWGQPAPGERYVVPEVDRDGDPWSPAWPVMGVSYHDAQAYARWWSGKTGVRHVLPSEWQWEKAARGVDGRFFPWGSRFDPALCVMRMTQEGRNSPYPVGHNPHDVSVYGMRDCVGSLRDWTWNPEPTLATDEYVVRGGSWSSAERFCRVCSRLGYLPHSAAMDQGFRLMREEPLRG
mgnify:CR=1 FL=1